MSVMEQKEKEAWERILKASNEVRRIEHVRGLKQFRGPDERD